MRFLMQRVGNRASWMLHSNFNEPKNILICKIAYECDITYKTHLITASINQTHLMIV